MHECYSLTCVCIPVVLWAMRSQMWGEKNLFLHKHVSVVQVWVSQGVFLLFPPLLPVRSSHLCSTRHTSAANKKRDSWIIYCHQLIINPIKHRGCRWLPGSATHLLREEEVSLLLMTAAKRCYWRGLMEAGLMEYLYFKLRIERLYFFGVFKIASLYQSAFCVHGDNRWW